MEGQEKKIQEMQMLEQNFQSLLMQKQAFTLELNETKAALKELESAGDEVFKIIGQLMIKSDKKKMKDDLLNKEKILDLRMKTIEKQEGSMAEQLDSLREELMKSMNKK